MQKSCLFGRVLISAILASLAAGCSSVRGAPLAMDREGPINTTATAGPASLFNQREVVARAATGAQVPSASLLMLDSGLGLVAAGCEDYFNSAGSDQRNATVYRQALNAIGGLATTLMLIENVDPDSITLVELAQGSANTGLDIWTENYLFSVENIETVRELVRKAMDASAIAIRELGPFTYDSAAGYIIAHQNLCQPRRIAALVMDAVKAGDVIAKPSTVGQDSQAVVRDREGRRLLAEAFAVPGSLTDGQIGGLWWLLMNYSTPETRKAEITQLLGALAPAVLNNAEVRSDWTRQQDVRRALVLLSSGTQTVLAETSKNAQTDADRRADPANEAVAAAGTEVQELLNFGATLPPADRNRFARLLEDIPLAKMVEVPGGQAPTVPAPLPVFVLPSPTTAQTGFVITVE